MIWRPKSKVTKRKQKKGKLLTSAMTSLTFNLLSRKPPTNPSIPCLISSSPRRINRPSLNPIKALEPISLSPLVALRIAPPGRRICLPKLSSAAACSWRTRRHHRSPPPPSGLIFFPLSVWISLTCRTICFRSRQSGTSSARARRRPHHSSRSSPSFQDENNNPIAPPTSHRRATLRRRLAGARRPPVWRARPRQSRRAAVFFDSGEICRQVMVNV